MCGKSAIQPFLGYRILDFCGALVSYAVFHSCQYGSVRQKKSMVIFSHREFEVVNAMCKGQNSGKWHLPFIPQIVEARTSRGSLVSAHTTSSLPKAIDVQLLGCWESPQ